MKRATKGQVYKACELLEIEDCEYSCSALRRAGSLHNEDYTCMFGINYFSSAWPNSQAFAGVMGRYKHERILALLLYLTARDNI